MVKGNATPEEQSMLEKKLEDLHVSNVNTISILGASTDDGMFGIIMLDSCCGDTAYAFNVEQLAQLLKGISGCLEAMTTQVH